MKKLKETTTKKDKIRLLAYLISKKHPDRPPDENWTAAIQTLNKENPFRHLITLWKWTGIGEKKGWDILQLIITASIPLLIFFGTQYFTSQNNKQQRETAKDNANQETLVNYLGEMATLLDDGLLKVTMVSDKKFIIAQAKTVIALQSLDSQRQHLVIQFLDASNLNTITGKEKGLLYKARISKADLHSADLSGSKLIKADLSNTNLSNANLSIANLSNANLLFANLSDANLYSANLSNANLSGSKLINTYLRNTNLSNANLGSATLNGAIFLSSDLRKIKRLTKSQLEGKEHPLICKSLIPQNINIELERDCDKIGAALLKKFPKEFSSLEKANEFVSNQQPPNVD